MEEVGGPEGRRRALWAPPHLQREERDLLRVNDVTHQEVVY